MSGEPFTFVIAIAIRARKEINSPNVIQSFPKLNTLDPRIISGAKRSKKIKHPKETGNVKKTLDKKTPPPFTYAKVKDINKII